MVGLSTVMITVTCGCFSHREAQPRACVTRGLLSCLLRVSRRRVWRRGAGVRALRGDRAVRPS